MQIPLSNREAFLFKKIGRTAEKLGFSAFVVGGFVRDKLLQRPTKDADIVCLGDGIALAQAVADQFNPIPPVSIFKTFGTAQIKLPDVEIEFVGARKESYRSDSRKPEVAPGSLEDDQNRRDFTINAMAISLNANNYGILLDPFNGVGDLEEKIIQTPLEPLQTFSDDPLRMMRAIRFATQLHFIISPATFEAIKNEKERINIISKERITDELNKIVMSKNPSIGFDLLYKTGLLQIIFPQMVALAGAQNVEGIGHKDNFYHTLQVLDNISQHTDNLWLRWAAIMHDMGKPATKRFEEGHGWTFHGHEAISGRMVPKVFDLLKLPLHEPMRYVKKLVELHHRPISVTNENITDSAIRRLLFDAGNDFEDLMTLCSADITSKNKQKIQRYLQNFKTVKQRCRELEEKDHIRTWQPPIDGQQIMDIFGISPSKPIGILKTALKDAILDGEIENNHGAAFQFLINKAKEIGLQPVIK